MQSLEYQKKDIDIVSTKQQQSIVQKIKQHESHLPFINATINI